MKWMFGFFAARAKKKEGDPSMNATSQKKPAPTEAHIVINGIELSEAQSCTLRITIANHLQQLKAMGAVADTHRARLTEVQDLIFTAFTPTRR